MKKLTVVFIEIGMLFGVIAAAFMVPRNTPLLTFGVISCAIFALGNVLIIKEIRRSGSDGKQTLTPKRERRLNLIIVLFAIYWLICIFLRKR